MNKDKYETVEWIVWTNPESEKYFLNKNSSDTTDMQKVVDDIQMIHEKSIVYKDTKITNFHDWLLCQFILTNSALQQVNGEE